MRTESPGPLGPSASRAGPSPPSPLSSLHRVHLHQPLRLRLLPPMPALPAALHMALSEHPHLGFPAGLPVRILMRPLLPSPAAHTEASPTGLLPQAAALLGQGLRLPVRGRLDRGGAGVLGHRGVSKTFYFTRHVDAITDLEAGFGGSSFGSPTDAASDASTSSTPSWFGGASGDYSGGWWRSRIMRHRQ